MLPGPFNSKESRKAFAKLLLELESGSAPVHDPYGMTMNEMFAAHLGFAEKHYRRADGTPTREVDEYKAAFAGRVLHRPHRQLDRLLSEMHHRLGVDLLHAPDVGRIGRYSRDRETLSRFSTRSDDPFRTSQQTGSKSRLSEVGERDAGLAKKGGNKESREFPSRLVGVNQFVDVLTGKNSKLPERNTLRNNTLQGRCRKMLAGMGIAIPDLSRWQGRVKHS